MKKQANIIINSVLHVLLLSACSGSSEHHEETNTVAEQHNLTLTAKQEKLAGIATANISYHQLKGKIQVSGKIDVPPQNLVSVCVPMGGYLKRTELLPGKQIKKGEVLAIMTDREYIRLQQEYLRSKNNLRVMEAEYKRLKELNRDKTVSDKQFQEAELAWQNEQVNCNSLIQNLQLININPDKLTASTISSDIRIISPISGYVSRIKFNTGKYVNPSDILFELIDPKDIHLNLTVYEKDLDKIAIGQEVSAFSNSNPTKRHVCDIILISMDMAANNSTEVHCHFKNYDPRLIPGMFMNAEVNIQSNRSICVEEGAIVQFEGKHYIFLQEAGRQYRMLAIEKGIQDGSWVEIKALNNEKLLHKKVVNQGAYALLMELKNASEEE